MYAPSTQPTCQSTSAEATRATDSPARSSLLFYRSLQHCSGFRIPLALSALNRVAAGVVAAGQRGSAAPAGGDGAAMVLVDVEVQTEEVRPAFDARATQRHAAQPISPAYTLADRRALVMATRRTSRTARKAFGQAILSHRKARPHRSRANLRSATPRTRALPRTSRQPRCGS